MKISMSVTTSLALFLVALIPLSTQAQCTNTTSDCTQTVPHLVKVSGVLKNASTVRHSGVIAVRFTIYSDSIGGTPLWQEVQNTQFDEQGRYEVMLGATSVTDTVTAWLEVSVPSLATTLKL